MPAVEEAPMMGRKTLRPDTMGVMRPWPVLASNKVDTKRTDNWRVFIFTQALKVDIVTFVWNSILLQITIINNGIDIDEFTI